MYKKVSYMNKKQNVLIVLADQQRYDTIAAAGFGHMITPNLDRFANEGCVFTHAHTHNPVCMPARHDLLVGQPASNHGYFSNAGKQSIKDYGTPTVARVFSENGYRTASIGKMHFRPVRAHHGYNEMYTMEEIVKCRQDDDFAMHLKENGQGDVQNIHGVRPLAYMTPQKALVEEQNYETNWVKDTTINWLDRNGDQPFFLFVGYIKPHPPWDVLEKYQGMYKDAPIPPAIARSRCFPASVGVDPLYGDLDTAEQTRKNQEAYYTAVSMVDESFGEIIEHLRETGQLDNTLVIYTSDHGEMLGDKGYYAKNLPYESSVRVPMIVRYPKAYQAGSKNDDFVDLLDIFPTCLDVAGLAYPDCNNTLYGSSLLDTKQGKDREIYIAANGFLGDARWVMARSKEYKYIYQYAEGYEELYDLINDPQELHNCIEAHKNDAVHQKLRASALAYEATYGPEGAVQDGDFVQFSCDKKAKPGKYFPWINMQFQKFLEQDKAAFGETFVREIKEALSNREITGCDVKEIFNDPQWKEWFAKGFAQVGEYENWEKELFL